MTAFQRARDLELFALSVAILLVAHVFRATRMISLYPRNTQVRRFDLLYGLIIGYCVNTFVPARLGELVRTLYVGKRCHIRYAYVGATVIAERLSDAVFLGIVCAALLLTGVLPHAMTVLIVMVLAASAAGILVALITKKSRRIRHAIWKVASIFNSKICYGIADLAWSYSEIVTSRLMLRGRYVLLTFVMWVFYGISYLAFGLAAHAPLTNVVYTILGAPLHSMLQIVNGHLTNEQYLLLGFVTIPLVIILIVGLLRDRNSVIKVWGSLLLGRFNTWDFNPSPVSERFKEETEYEYFLLSLFAGGDQRVTGFGLSAIEDGVVHRLFHGGSGAITALVEAEGDLKIRKFALGDAKDKLKVQVDWLRKYQSHLPLVEIMAERMESSFYRYDMPYPPQATDFYDVIHTVPIEKSKNILVDVVSTIHDFHKSMADGEISESELEQYMVQKVVQNANHVLSFTSDVIGGEQYRLNDQDYSLSDWKRIQDPAWLRRQISDKRVTKIHGDLTIENIIVSPTHPRGWYLIDPNTGNVFDSPFIDWAKLRQSLNLGYEGLNKAATCTWRGPELSLVLTRSHAYNQLNEILETLLVETSGAEAYREVRFHELVNYLRLTPYKIRQSPEKGLTFFACTSILLAAYLRDYDR